MMDVLRVGACTFLDGEKLFSWRGDSIMRNMGSTDNDIRILDLTSNEWTSRSTGGNIPPSTTGCGATAINGKAYLFGGFNRSIDSGFKDTATYYRDLYELNLNTFKWRRLAPVNDKEAGPMEKYIFGIGSLNGSVLIFGGFGQKGARSQSWSQYDWSEEFNASWTNELHLYNPNTNLWINPVIEGIKPSPCAAFCFNKIDKSRFLMFGGRQLPSRVNEVHILDTTTWSWSGPILSNGLPGELWPSARSLHTGASLIDPDTLDPPSTNNTDDNSTKSIEQSVLVLWGQDHVSDQISNLWLLRVDSLKWEKLDSCKLIGKKWHSTEAAYLSSGESVVVTVGGFCQNQSSWRVPKQEDTVLMRFGVANLYTLCLRYFSTYYPKPSQDLLNYLPVRVAQDIQRTTITAQAKSIDNFTHYNLVAKVVKEESCMNT